MLYGILIANTVFQIVAVFNGWMITIDPEGHYMHGPYYGVYMIVYLSITAVIIIQFILYGRSFRRQNRKSLISRKSRHQSQNRKPRNRIRRNRLSLPGRKSQSRKHRIPPRLRQTWSRRQNQ